MRFIQNVQTFLLIFYFQKCDSLRIKDEMRQDITRQNEAKCVELGKNPYFDIDQIVGKPWRVYYSWNINMGLKCIDMTFKNSTPSIVNRFLNDMYEYMETNPNWDAATMTISSAQTEMLLFANQGPAGSFDGIPDIRTGNLKPIRKGVPLLKFFIKLIEDGKFLLVFDCQIGVATLSSRDRPFKKEIEEVAKKLNIGEGTRTCDFEKHKDQFIPN